MAGRHREDRADDTKLDDLFGEVEPARAGEPSRWWVLRGVVQTFVVSAVLYTLARALGLAPSLLLIVAVSAGAVMVRLAAVSVREVRGQRPVDLMRGPAVRAEPITRADGVLVAVRRWDRRLANTDQAAADLGPALGELADERLRQRYGITRASDPARARGLLGEPVWALLAGTAAGRSNVTAAQAETAIRRLESM